MIVLAPVLGHESAQCMIEILYQQMTKADLHMLACRKSMVQLLTAAAVDQAISIRTSQAYHDGRGFKECKVYYLRKHTCACRSLCGHHGAVVFTQHWHAFLVLQSVI